MNNISQHQAQFDNLTSDRVYYRDQDFKLISANKAFLEDIGCENLEDAEGTRLDEKSIHAQALQEALVAVEEQILQTQKSQIRKQIRCTINNNASVVAIECHPVFTEDNTFSGLACRYSVQGLSQLHGIDKLLLDALLKNTKEFIYFKDDESRFIRVSDRIVERLGAENVESVPGTTDFDYWDSECAQGFFDSEQEIMETRQPLIGVCEQEVRNDGRETWVLSSKMPLEDENGNVIGTFGVSRDVTELKETELKLKEANQQLISASRRAGMAEIASNVIHNVGNVLNSVNVSLSMSKSLLKNSGVENLNRAADLLENNRDTPNFLSENEKGKVLPDYLRMSAKSIADMHNKVEDELKLLDRNIVHIQTIISMQQKHAGAGGLIENTPVTKVVEDAICIGQCTLNGTGVAIETEIFSEVEAEIDKHRVLQILVNLIRNAKHACQDNKTEGAKKILVSIDKSTEHFFTIEVSDNGIGIDPENLTNIFSHGFTTKKKGSGFGLHSSANTAKELGGSLIATSAGKGQGASFVLNLPIKPKLRSEAKTTTDVTTIGTTEHASPVIPIEA